MKKTIIFFFVATIFYSCNITSEQSTLALIDSLGSKYNTLKDYPVIDVHQHLYNDVTYWGGPQASKNLNSPTTAMLHYKRLVEVMKENNVVLGLPSTRMETCEYYFNTYPENRQLFYYGLDFWYAPDAVCQPYVANKLDSLVKVNAINVIGELFGVYYGKSHDDSCYQSLYAIADKYNIPVSIHTGVIPDNWLKNFPNYSIELANPASLRPILKKWSNINFNAMHSGLSYSDKYNFENNMIDMLLTFDNLYCDIGAACWMPETQLKTEKFILSAIEKGLEDRILFGSDQMVWPDAVSVGIKFIKDANFLTLAQKKKILYRNAAQFLRLDKEQIKRHFLNSKI